MKSYSFAVPNPADIDIDRILAENPEADVFLLQGQPHQRLIAARTTWLEQFAEGDNLYLGPEPLSAQWGWCALIPRCSDGAVTFEVATEIIDGERVPQGQARFALTSLTAANIRKEFAEAQTSLTRRRKITVEVLG